MRQREDEMTIEAINGELRRWMVAALGCALEIRSTLYVSTPITTGLRFVTWRRGDGALLEPGTNDYGRAHLEAVIGPNRDAVTCLVEDLRKQRDEPVIDPTALEDVPGWRQFDYHRFWVAVIERYACRVRFTTGWQYSSGCVYELAAAVRHGLPLEQEDGSPLTLSQARHLVDAAIEDIRTDNVLPTTPLEDALNALGKADTASGPSAPGPSQQ